MSINSVYIIAGETSGDLLAADFIKALKQKYPNVSIHGVAGDQSLSAGLPETLFPMAELSIMGVAEIVPKVPHILKRIRQTVEDIKRLQPDIILTIDSPDFSFRVQKAIKKQNLGIKQVRSVAPTVWAWRAGRARKISQFLDGILCLFPFEPPYFEKEGLAAAYVGHPVIDRYSDAPSCQQARKELGYNKDDQVLGVLFGSRQGELKRHGQIICDGLKQIVSEKPHTMFLVPTLPHLTKSVETLLQNNFEDMSHFKIVTNTQKQTTYFRAMSCALAVSGTVGLELAIAGTPHLVAYKANALTAAIIRRVIKTEYAHLANIILKRRVVPECLQENCTGSMLAKELLSLDVEQQKREFKTLTKKLETNQSPADTIIEFLEKL